MGRPDPQPDWPILTRDPFDLPTQLTRPAHFATSDVEQC